MRDIIVGMFAGVCLLTYMFLLVLQGAKKTSGIFSSWGYSWNPLKKIGSVDGGREEPKQEDMKEGKVEMKEQKMPAGDEKLQQERPEGQEVSKQKCEEKPEQEMKGEKRTSEEWAREQLNRVEEDTKPIEERTRELFIHHLQGLGCQYMEGEDGAVDFSYLGGHFRAFFSNGPFVGVYYNEFYSIALYEQEKQERAKDLINTINSRFTLQIFYYIDPGTGKFGVWARDSFLLIPEIPEIQEYIKVLLELFFAVHHHFICEMERT